MDTDVIPLGERAVGRILEHVLAVGDEAETSYLEVKSALDPANLEGIAKIAKFLLGTSNRLPHDAARHFRGYAVLVIGAAKGRADGITRGTEAHELEDRLRPYLGPQFPAFELGRITVGPDREVLFVIAQPPKDGQSIFPCHKDLQGAKPKDNLNDGAIYMRGSSNTRPAKSGEVLALIERARSSGRPPISLDVEILGRIGRIDRIDEVLGRLYDFAEEKYTNPVSRDRAPTSGVTSEVFRLSPSSSARERTHRLEKWNREKESHVSTGRAHFLGVALPGMGIRVTSLDRFVSKPELIVTFRDCEAFPYHDAADADYDKMVKPIAPRAAPFDVGLSYADIRLRPLNHPVSWRNSGEDVEVILTPDSFRPNAPWLSGDDDYVVLSRNPQETSVKVQWSLTEDGNNAVSTGELEVTLSASTDAYDLIDGLFFNAT